MQELPKQLLAWLGRLLPKQEVTGKSNVQVGQVGGNVTVINHHHHAPRRATPRASEEQKAVLRLMDELPDRFVALDFMEREFNTRMVIELKPAQLYRLRRYVETIHSNLAKGRAT